MARITLVEYLIVVCVGAAGDLGAMFPPGGAVAWALAAMDVATPRRRSLATSVDDRPDVAEHHPAVTVARKVGLLVGPNPAVRTPSRRDSVGSLKVGLHVACG